MIELIYYADLINTNNSNRVMVELSLGEISNDDNNTNNNMNKNYNEISIV